ncbi:MAG: diguanylate cyclase [Arcobacteraceae bacterium]|nr:diguanylate cyclase [Arcobacteraceae bacterium]MDY0327379.1 diguanylate cyclase [Arcobacteraceae bacterium]
MNIKFFFQQNLVLFWGFIIVLIVSIGILYLGTLKLEKKLKSELLAISTEDMIAISNNISKKIEEILKNQNIDNDMLDFVLDNSELQYSFENILTPIITKNIKFAYLIYKDSSGVFRYLVDGSYIDKMETKTKFDADSKEWFEIYNTKKPIIIKHNTIQALSMTYLVPVIYNDNVIFVLAVDLSIDKFKDIEDVWDIVQYGVLAVIIVILIFLCALIFQIFRFYKMHKAVYIDKLTGAYNRNYLHDFEQVVNLNQYILAVLDIDYFKKINDIYGHDAGDIILKNVTQYLQQNLRDDEDILIRYGGEEFCLFVKKDRNHNKASLNVLDRIFNNLQTNKFEIMPNKLIQVTVSIGVNLEPGNSESFKDAFAIADKLLYEAKNGGRNKIVLNADKTD